MGGVKLDFCGSGKGKVTKSRESSNEISGLINRMEFIDKLGTVLHGTSF